MSLSCCHLGHLWYVRTNCINCFCGEHKARSNKSSKITSWTSPTRLTTGRNITPTHSAVYPVFIHLWWGRSDHIPCNLHYYHCQDHTLQGHLCYQPNPILPGLNWIISRKRTFVFKMTSNTYKWKLYLIVIIVNIILYKVIFAVSRTQFFQDYVESYEEKEILCSRWQAIHTSGDRIYLGRIFPINKINKRIFIIQVNYDLIFRIDS